MTERPIPMPDFLVVENGVKSSLRISGAMPAPVSATAI